MSHCHLIPIPRPEDKIMPFIHYRHPNTLSSLPEKRLHIFFSLSTCFGEKSSSDFIMTYMLQVFDFPLRPWGGKGRMSTLFKLSTKAAWSQLWHRSNAKPVHQWAGKGVEYKFPPATPPTRGCCCLDSGHIACLEKSKPNWSIDTSYKGLLVLVPITAQQPERRRQPSFLSIEHFVQLTFKFLFVLHFNYSLSTVYCRAIGRTYGR